MFIQTNRVRSILLPVFAGLAVTMLSGCAGRHAAGTGQTGNHTQASMAVMQVQAAAWDSTRIIANCVTKPTDIEVSLPDGTKESTTVDLYPPQGPNVNADIRLIPGTTILELTEGAARMQRSRIVRVKPKRVTLGQNAGIMDITSAADPSNGNQYVSLEKSYAPGAVLEVILNSSGASVLLNADGDLAEIKIVNGVDTITKKSLTSLQPNHPLLVAIERLKLAMR